MGQTGAAVDPPEHRGQWCVKLVLVRLAGLLLLPVDFIRYGVSEGFFIGRDAPIFVVGCGHSGTSLVRLILGRNRAVYDLGPETWLFVGAGSSVIAFARFLARRPFRTLRNYRLAASAAHRQAWVEKTPMHVHEALAIKIVAPWARFVSVIRDGRDVVASLRERGYSIDDAIDRWMRDTAAAITFPQSRSGVMIRYEDLVESPEELVKQLCERFGMRFDETMLKATGYEKPQALDDSDHSRRRNAQLRSAIFDGRGRWLRDLSDDEALLFDRRAGQMNEELGYETCAAGLAKRLP